MIGLVLLFTGCASDDEYIAVVKGLKFTGGDSVKSIVLHKLTGVKFEIENAGQMDASSGNYIYLRESRIRVYPEIHSKVDIGNAALGSGVVPVNLFDQDITWEIEGDTADGKVITTTTETGMIRITVTEDGDYVTTNTDDIVVVNYDGLLIDELTININVFINECILAAILESDSRDGE